MLKHAHEQALGPKTGHEKSHFEHNKSALISANKTENNIAEFRH